MPHTTAATSATTTTSSADSRPPQPDTSLTREKINRLVLSHLDAELHSRYMANICRGYRSPAYQEEEYEVISSALADTLEDIDSGHVPRSIKELADSILTENDIENPRHSQTAAATAAAATAAKGQADGRA